MRFTLPRDLYHGEGALEALKTFTGKKAMVCVGGGSMKRFGFLDKVISYLKEAGMEVELFEGIEPDPSVETVMRGAEAMLKFEPDWIVAIGGGSPIDAAKAMWIKYEYPECTFEDMCKVFGIPPLRRKAHFCAISSTSGTATEVTASPSSQIIRRASSTRSLISRSLLMSLLLIPHWLRPCLRSWLPTLVWMRSLMRSRLTFPPQTAIILIPWLSMPLR